MTKVILCIGSNVPDCRHEVVLAMQWLETMLADASMTEPYFTVPEWSCAGVSPYLNAVVDGYCDMSQADLSTELKAYEQSRGRCPCHKKEGRIIIDIDLVCYGDSVVDIDEYTSSYFNFGYSMLRHQLPGDADAEGDSQRIQPLTEPL